MWVSLVRSVSCYPERCVALVLSSPGRGKPELWEADTLPVANLLLCICVLFGFMVVECVQQKNLHLNTHSHTLLTASNFFSKEHTQFVSLKASLVC